MYKHFASYKKLHLQISCCHEDYFLWCSYLSCFSWIFPPPSMLQQILHIIVLCETKESDVVKPALLGLSTNYQSCTSACKPNSHHCKLSDEEVNFKLPSMSILREGLAPVWYFVAVLTGKPCHKMQANLLQMRVWGAPWSGKLNCAI